MGPFFTLLAGIGMVYGSLFLPAGLVSYESKTSVNENAPPLSYLPPDLITMLTAGHRRVYDDLIYLWLIQHIVPEKVGEYTIAPDILEKRIHNTLRQLPKIESLYLISCLTMALKLHKPESCAKISEFGLKGIPENWRVSATQAYIYAFKLENPVKASFYYHQASKNPKAPQFVHSLAKKLLEKKSLGPEDHQNHINYLKQLPGWESFEHFSGDISQKRPL